MEKSKYIWLDGELVDWDSANVSVMTHTLHYGIGVYRVNRDGSITWIAEIDREGRKDLSKIHQKTWGKIK